MPISPRSYPGKRLLDLVVAVPVLVVSSWVMALVALAIWIEDRGGALFRQRRMGANGETFEIIKFRSMPVNTPDRASASADDLKVTRVGEVIRRLSLDELPQLICVLRGSMSIVGPRPALPTQDHLLELRDSGGSSELLPGLTGWAQVNSFDGMSDDEKVAFDNQYASSMSLAFDIKILFRTVKYLLSEPPVY